MKSNLEILALIILVTSTVKSELAELTLDNFKQHFGCDVYSLDTCSTSFKNQWFLMFMAPWCGHCQRAKPQFEAFSSQLAKGNIGLIANQMRVEQGLYSLDPPFIRSLTVNCQEQRQLCRQFGIRGYPTMIYITSDMKGIKYKGQRTAKSFVNFTLFHDPERYQTGEYVQLAHSYWKDLFNELKAYVLKYWVQLIVFALIAPALGGYLLGRLIFGKVLAPKPQPVAQPAQQTEIKVNDSEQENKKQESQNKKQE